MTLEDFEKSLAEIRQAEEEEQRQDKSHRKHREHRHHHHHHRSRHHDEDDHRHKRRRKSYSDDDDKEGREERKKHKHRRDRHDSEGKRPKEDAPKEEKAEAQSSTLKRDAWMEIPSAFDVEIVHRKEKVIKQPLANDSKAHFEQKLHESELHKHHLQDSAMKQAEATIAEEPAIHQVDYVFGDTGSQWRMTKLKNVYRQAEESGQSVEEMAMKQYGDLRAFDDAREEEIELGRRETYGEGYVGKEKPSSELFQERKLDMGIRRPQRDEFDNEPVTQMKDIPTDEPPRKTINDPTELNRLKAKMMKAKLRGAPDAAKLEAEYNAASSGSIATGDPGVVVLGAMESRMLAGGRQGEVKPIDNKRGRERGLVQDNEDMSIDDMVREERRIRGRAGGDGLLLAERIAKDGKFDNDLEYMDENANKLAKRVHKSDSKLRNQAVTELQKMNRITDSCSLCHHEDTSTPPTAPLISLGTRVYLTLPTEPELTENGAVIVPIQHHKNLLECDDDEWEEIRNFQKSLTRFYASLRLLPIFYENASRPHRSPHAALVAIPLSSHLHEQSPAFFREAILSAATEWSQHRKLIDTEKAAHEKGLGKMAFRRSLAKEMPYFHVWFDLDGGLGHVVEDEQSWPRGDGFARQVLGGMLRADEGVIRRQGRWVRGDARADGFRKMWGKWDWTKALLDAGS